jgi:hypothetical protein
MLGLRAGIIQPASNKQHQKAASRKHGTALADLSGFFEGERQLQDSPIVMMPANDLNSDRETTA